MKRANLLSNKEKGYLLSPEYRLQVKQTKVPSSVRHRPNSIDLNHKYYVSNRGVNINEDPNIYY